MGGFGSSRWDWEQTRVTTDGLISLDVRWLARVGALSEGRHEVSWSRDGQVTDRVLVSACPGAVVLDYLVSGRTKKVQLMQEPVALERIPCRFGGTRPWFRCPGCGERRAVLWLVAGHFRCRTCHQLAYQSSRETDWLRAGRKASKLRTRLLSARSDRLPARPKGMHQRTYVRRLGQLAALERVMDAGLATRFGAAFDPGQPD